MIKNRKLTDLFVRGKEVAISDETGEMKVWLQKLNASEHEAIIRHANAARARCLAMKNDTSSEEYQAMSNDILDLDKEEMINLIIGNEIMTKASAIESEFSEKDEWAKDGYLQGLRDAWLDGMSDEYALEQSEESTKIFDELTRFTEQVDKEIELVRENLIADHLERTLDSVFKDAVESTVAAQSNIEWLKGYRKGEVVYATRDPNDHKVRLLDWNSVDQLQEEVFNFLMEEYRLLTVDPTEGKD